MSKAILRSVQVGPDPRGIGGMESVIREYLRWGDSSLLMRNVVTWRIRSSRRKRAQLLFSGVTLLVAERMGSLRRREQMLVHAHLSHYGSFLREGAFIMLARAMGVPVVATVHGDSFVESIDRSSVWRLICGGVLRACSRVIALNAESLAAVARVAPKSRMTILRNPGPRSHPPEKIAPETNAVVFAGSVGQRKGVDVLLAAWPHVLRACPAAVLYVLGPKEAGFEIPTTKAEIVGPVDPAEVQSYIDRARVAVLPSRAEAMPMFVLEAMAAGRPSVVSNVGALPGLGAGYVVEPGDVSGLASGLILYLTNHERAVEDGQRAHAHYQESFSPKVVRVNLLEVYSEAVGNADYIHRR